MKLSNYGVTEEHKQKAIDKINDALNDAKLAEWDSEESKNCFIKFATFFLCLEHISKDYNVFIWDEDITGVPFVLEHDCDPVAYSPFITLSNGRYLSVIDLDAIPIQDSTDYKMSCSEELISGIIEEIQILPNLENKLTLEFWELINV